MDELLERVEQKKVWGKQGNVLVSIMAFVGDLIPIVEDLGDMNIAIECCKNFFDEKGLLVNSTKLASLKVPPVKGKKAMDTVTVTHRYWKEEPILSIDFEKLGK